MYQVWDKDNVNNINDKRRVYYMFAKTWVELFSQIQEFNNKNDELVFTPNAIMETEDGNYAFVIHKACMNSFFSMNVFQSSAYNNLYNK